MSTRTMKVLSGHMEYFKKQVFSSNLSRIQENLASVLVTLVIIRATMIEEALRIGLAKPDRR